MGLFSNIDKWDLKYFLEAVGQHYVQAWMADYDPDEVGEYLQRCYVSHTGLEQVRVSGGSDFPATRAGFLKWRYAKNYPEPTQEVQE